MIEFCSEQVTELESRLAVACGSPATPQVMKELDWLLTWMLEELQETRAEEPAVPATVQAAETARQR